MLLAAAGARVKVFERLPHVGGRTSTLEAQGFKFDLGPTFFLYPRILKEIFASVGADLESEVEMVRLDPQYRILFGAGGELNCTREIAAMEAQIGRICERDAFGFRRFLEENRAKLEMFRPCMEQAFLSWKDMLTKRILQLLPRINPHLSVDGYLKKFFSDPRVRLAFSFQSKYLGMSPFRCPSLFSILSFLEYEYGVFHPVGGCGEVSKTMARLATEAGVEFHLSEPIEEILFRGRKAVGVRTATGSHFADAVVVNADFARAMERLIPDRLRRRWTNKQLERKKYSCSTFMMYLGVDGEFQLPHHNIYIAEQYEENLKDIDERHVLSSDPSFYVQNASVTDRTLAPAGQSALYVLAPVTHKHPNVDWSKERSRFRSLLLEQIRKAGFEDVEKRIRYERVLTPDDWDRQYQIYRGATFNLAHNLSQLLHLRPRNRFEDVDGVYLVGGGTHPGSGLPVIFESARITSRLLLDDLGMQSRVCEIPALRQNAIEALSPGVAA